MKNFLLILTMILLGTNAVFAEKIPLKITPAQDISTAYDEVEVFDPIKFKVIKDVYYKNKVLIAKDTFVIGIVDFVSENGWMCDNAQLQFKNFKTKDTNNNIINLESPITLDGFKLIETKANRKAQFFNYIGVVVRGKEVDIKNGVDKPVFTIWLSK